jgi:hypothetical protein
MKRERRSSLPINSRSEIRTIPTCNDSLRKLTRICAGVWRPPVVFRKWRPSCQKAVALNEARVHSDKNNVQAAADLASSHFRWGSLCIVCIRHKKRWRWSGEPIRCATMWLHAIRTRLRIQSTTLSLYYIWRIEADLLRPVLVAPETRTSRGDAAASGRAQLEAPRWMKRAKPSKRSPRDTAVILPH